MKIELTPSTVTIPIKIVNGYPCLAPRGRLPELRDDTLGELVVPVTAFVNRAEAALYTRKETKMILKRGTVLMALISAKSIPPHLASSALKNNCQSIGPAVEILLLEDQLLMVRGITKAELCPCHCRIPSLDDTAISINHAYTKISEAYEPHRISHTANVFDKVHFKRNNVWHPLKELRGY